MTEGGELVVQGVSSKRDNAKWAAPRDPLALAWLLREMLRHGKHQLVLSCERTRQVEPEKMYSPVIVCSPENCDVPCFNCMMAILIGRKPWTFYDDPNIGSYLTARSQSGTI
jgi:hypothetical protein